MFPDDFSFSLVGPGCISRDGPCRFVLMFELLDRVVFWVFGRDLEVILLELAEVVWVETARFLGSGSVCFENSGNATDRTSLNNNASSFNIGAFFRLDSPSMRILQVGHFEVACI